MVKPLKLSSFSIKVQKLKRTNNQGYHKSLLIIQTWKHVRQRYCIKINGLYLWPLINFWFLKTIILDLTLPHPFLTCLFKLVKSNSISMAVNMKHVMCTIHYLHSTLSRKTRMLIKASSGEFQWKENTKTCHLAFLN